ncbi:BTB/POZ domain-containing protein [Aspergillus neoniger CBS 115656]|uniref:Uncharacterized protein n=1 Tax=Aspergillus neoniger (strain CBS 115656) TaxID=1448310 RepID=A0A318Y922_ASPNB|nr:hypothetical protein BO87DRAFT_342894 [Aspergillus neoniger CBS 115656]PYH30454.1 hypothetical protein BO87DRAFT_342894 [Aspergillus neoniger CBS 115656]
MDQPTHTIDPEGDVIIVLSNANSPFAPDDHEDTTAKKNSDSDSKTSDEEEDQHREKRPRLVEEQPSETPTEDGHLSETPDEKCFRIQVSAKHLILASPVFRNMLTGNWKESVSYLQKGSVEITAESWDIEAFLIFLRAIHGQQSQIPRKLSLEMLAKIAVLINYYDCKDAVSILTELWIDGLEDKIPATYTRDLMLWLWVSAFFKLSSQFQTSTSNVMTHCDHLITNRGLPIPENIINVMNERRSGVINGILLRLNKMREDLLSGSRGCDFECRSMTLGALTMHMNSNDLLPLEREAPFSGLSYAMIFRKIQSFRSPEWYSAPRSVYYDRLNADSSPHRCQSSSFNTVIQGMTNAINGLGSSIMGL